MDGVELNLEEELEVEVEAETLRGRTGAEERYD